MKSLAVGLTAFALAALSVVALHADAAQRPVASLVAAAADDDAARNLSVSRPAERPLRVLFAGDSLTYGVAASSPARGFRPLMVGALSQAGPVEEFHTEQAGAGAGTVSNLLDVPAGLDLAIIELGTNNVGTRAPIPEFTATYSALLEKIRAGSPNVPLLCVGTWGSEGGGFGSDPYNAVIHSQCANRGGAFVSLYDVYAVAANRGPAGLDSVGGRSDPFHPNTQGHRAIAELLLSRIEIR